MNVSQLLVVLSAIFTFLLSACGGGGGGGSGDDPEFELYDSFDTAIIDRTKWSSHEFVRRIEGGVLQSELTRFGSDGTNGLNLVNPGVVNEIQADVTVTAVANSNAHTQARVLGDFYNDGTAGGGFSGDIFAGIEIRHNGAGLVVAYFVARCENSDCSTVTDLIFDDSTFGPAMLGNTYTLSVAWDNIADMFTFGFDANSVNIDPVALGAPEVGPPQSANAFKGIGTRVDEIGGASEGAFIAATFDNVEVNGNPYDDFSTALIDRTKWLDQEFVRHIEGGRYVSELTRFGSGSGNNLQFINPAAIKGIQADVTITDFDNTSAIPRARLRGYFYNDGRPGTGHEGDVFADIELRHLSGQLLARYLVFLCDDPNCDTGPRLNDNIDLGPISLGVTYRLTMDWNGELFTFGLDNNMVTFDPTVDAPNMGPARVPVMSLNTVISGLSDPTRGAFISATFDNVRVKQ